MLCDVLVNNEIDRVAFSSLNKEKNLILITLLLL